MREREHRQIDLWSDADGDRQDIAQVVDPAVVLIDRMAKQVRMIYILCRREMFGDPSYGRSKMASWDGGENQFGTKRRPIWPKIAQAILAMGADPMEFTRAQFWAKQRMSNKPPAPNYLLSPEAQARWDEYQTYARDSVRRRLKADENAIRNGVQPLMIVLGWPRQEAYKYVVRDTRRVSASALYRYVVTLREGLLEDSSSIHDAALLQYVFQRDLYDAEWKGIVPDALRAEATALRTRLGCA
jgi:hypothetical protein